MRKVVAILGVVLLLVFCYLVPAPNFVRGGTSPLNGILNNLRKIDGAKQQWAFEHGVTNGAFGGSEKDIAPYLGRDKPCSFVNSIVAEQYTINPLSLSPEARLTRDLKIGRKTPYEKTYPKGTIIRFAANGGEEIILPAKQPSK